MRQLKQLQDENGRLKKLVAELKSSLIVIDIAEWQEKCLSSGALAIAVVFGWSAKEK